MPTMNVLVTMLCLVLLGVAAGASEPTAPVLVLGDSDAAGELRTRFLVAVLERRSSIATSIATRHAGAGWQPALAGSGCVIVASDPRSWPAAPRAELLGYVHSGGAAVLIGGAAAWSPADDGAIPGDHARGPQADASTSAADWRIITGDTGHPLTRGLPSPWLHYHEPSPSAVPMPQDAHLLCVAEAVVPATASAPAATVPPSPQAPDGPRPVLWWADVDKGRVVATPMGGEATAGLSCVGFQVVLARAVAWLRGQPLDATLPADFPTAERTSQDYPAGPAKVVGSDLGIVESMARFRLPPGYHIELVASEPLIEKPVMCAWDGDGRMFVAEMRTYMRDADARGEDEPASRVAVLSDDDGDGRMDRATVYADHLVLPRMVLPLDDRVVIAESYDGKFTAYRDPHHDGIATEKAVLFAGEPVKSNLEHQDSGLTWGIDNRIYSALLGSRRFRPTADGWRSEPIYGRSSQWGLAMDDLGRFYGSAAGGEAPAFGFQQHPEYGSLSLGGELAEGFMEVFPRQQTVDVQGGLGRVHPLRGTLNHFTGCCGQSIFRGDRLPGDLAGDYILPEPVGRLVRRAKIGNDNGMRVLANAYPGDEFITSTDPDFRPVWSATGPDGCLYIVDMHHGIIQEGNWTKPGSYLRAMIDRDGHAGTPPRGRIYCVVHDGSAPGPRPRMLQESPAALVEHLGHPNGWWRDTAQKLLVLRGDRGVVPALQHLAREGASALGRVHALWTLDGLGASDRALLVAALADPDARVRETAVRISEGLLRAGDAGLVAELAKLAGDPDIDVAVQVIDSLRYSDQPAAKQLIRTFAAAHPGSEVASASALQSLQYDPAHPGPVRMQLEGPALKLAQAGIEHYGQLCFACHGSDGKGVTSSDGIHLAPPLAGSPRVLGSADALVRIVLHGMAGELDGKVYAGPMLALRANDDRWLAEVLTYVRNGFGNSAGAITPEQVAAVRARAGEHPAPYALAELAPWLAIPAAQMKGWTFTASHNLELAPRAGDGDRGTRWVSGAPQAPGQWFQVDMGAPWRLTHLTLDAGTSRRDYPRGFSVQVSADGQRWTAVAEGQGGVLTEVDLAGGVTTRWLRIVLTASDPGGPFWAIHELTLFGTHG